MKKYPLFFFFFFITYSQIHYLFVIIMFTIYIM